MNVNLKVMRIMRWSMIVVGDKCGEVTKRVKMDIRNLPQIPTTLAAQSITWFHCFSEPLGGTGTGRRIPTLNHNNAFNKGPPQNLTTNILYSSSDSEKSNKAGPMYFPSNSANSGMCNVSSIWTTCEAISCSAIS